MLLERVAVGVADPHPLLGVVTRRLALANARVEGEQLAFVVRRGATGEDMIFAQFLGGPETDRQVFPVNEIAAPGVAPVHVPPLVSVRIVLIIDVIVAAEMNGTVRIVHPVRRREEMEDGTRRICLSARLGFSHTRHRMSHRVVKKGMDHRSIREGDMIDVDMPPAAGMVVHDLQSRLFPKHGKEIPRVPVQPLELIAGRRCLNYAVDQEIDADLAGMIPSADQKVEVRLGDGELRRDQRAGGFITTDVGVHKAASEKSRDRLLVRQRATSRSFSEGVTGRSPRAPIRRLEIAEDHFIGCALLQRGEQRMV